MTEQEKVIESLQRLRALHINDTCNGYRLSIALTEVIQALEKQIPKKMIIKPHTHLDLDLIYVCPNCETKYNRFYEGKPYCMFCGQKLLWKENE